MNCLKICIFIKAVFLQLKVRWFFIAINAIIVFKLFAKGISKAYLILYKSHKNVLQKCITDAQKFTLILLIVFIVKTQHYYIYKNINTIKLGKNKQ